MSIAGKKHKRNDAGITILANNIRKYRKLQNLTIEELANNCGYDYSQISRMERGVVNPSVSVIFDIAKALDITAAQLLEE